MYIRKMTVVKQMIFYLFPIHASSNSILVAILEMGIFIVVLEKWYSNSTSIKMLRKRI